MADFSKILAASPCGIFTKLRHLSVYIEDYKEIGSTFVQRLCAAAPTTLQSLYLRFFKAPGFCINEWTALHPIE